MTRFIKPTLTFFTGLNRSSFIKSKILTIFLYIPNKFRKLFMNSGIFQGNDVTSLIWQIHEDLAPHAPLETQIHSILFTLKDAFPGQNRAVDNLTFYCDKNGMKSEGINEALQSLQSQSLVHIRKDLVGDPVYFEDDNFKQRYGFLKGQSWSLNLTVHEFERDPCGFIAKTFSKAPYPFMQLFRFSFIQGLDSYILNLDPGKRPRPDEKCPIKSRAELKSAVCKSEIEFPKELNLFELEETFSQYVNSVVMVLDYAEDITRNDLASYKSLLGRIFDLGYDQIWTAFLNAYRIHSRQAEQTRDHLTRGTAVGAVFLAAYGIDNAKTESDQLLELKAQYGQQINTLSEECQKLESDVLKVAARYIPTELTEKQREILKSFSEA